jgi:protein SCO1/2
MRFPKQVDASQLHGTWLEKSRVIETFSLVGIDQKPFDNTSLQGRWTMMFFGFTHCGSVCPVTMAELAKMYRLLEEKDVKNLPRVVMISVDPERDSLDKLNHYVKAFDPHFYGARGDEEVISALTRELGVAWLKVTRHADDASEDYDIEHTGTVMLFNPKGELAAFFTTPHDAKLLAKDYMLIVNE